MKSVWLKLQEWQEPMKTIRTKTKSESIQIKHIPMKDVKSIQNQKKQKQIKSIPF